MISHRNLHTAAVRRSRDNIQQHKKPTTALRIITKVCANSLVRLTRSPNQKKNYALGNSPTMPSIGAALPRIVFCLPGSSMSHPVRPTTHFPPSKPKPKHTGEWHGNDIHRRCITAKPMGDFRTRSKICKICNPQAKYCRRSRVSGPKALSDKLQ